MTCFNQLMRKTGRRLMQQTAPRLSAHFTIMLALILTAGRSFGASGSSPVGSDELLSRPRFWSLHYEGLKVLFEKGPTRRGLEITFERDSAF
jgi:hypothetical protein